MLIRFFLCFFFFFLALLYARIVRWVEGTWEPSVYYTYVTLLTLTFYVIETDKQCLRTCKVEILHVVRLASVGKY